MSANVVMETRIGKSRDKLSSSSHERASSTDEQRSIHDENLDWRVSKYQPMDIGFIAYQRGDLAITDTSLDFQATRSIFQNLVDADHPIDQSSIHDTETAIEYVDRLKSLPGIASNVLINNMRNYLEKSRTTIGWKGLLNDPDIDESFKINKGFRPSRQRYYNFTDMGMPIASEMLDEISPHFLADLISVGDIGVRKTEHHLHYELASRKLSMAFKNGIDSSLGAPMTPPGAGRTCSSSRGRGQRKNNKYWKSMAEDEALHNPFELDCLFGKDDSGLIVPASSYMDSTCAVPRCMSLRYLHELGLGSKLSTDFRDPGPISTGMGGQSAKATGIVRDISFRLKGSSIKFKGDFYISELLDGFYDVRFGWQFMYNEAAGILEKAHKVYREAKAFVGRAASAFSKKINNMQKRVSDLVSDVSSPPPPPYSLVNILEGDFKVTPRLF